MTQFVYVNTQTLQIVDGPPGVQVEYDPLTLDPTTANITVNGDSITLVSDPVKVFEKGMKIIRNQRDVLLANSDWTQLPDVNLANKEEWAVYRQALRDLPKNTIDPTQVTWPNQPS